MAKQFQIILDFLLDVKADKAKIERLAKDIENLLQKAAPQLDFKDENVKRGIKELSQLLLEAENGVIDLEEALKALDIDIDNDEAKKAIEEIKKTIEELDKVELSGLDSAIEAIEKSDIDKSVEKIEEALNSLDSEKFGQEIEKLADAFVKSRNETEQLLNKQKVALQALKASGKEGSEAYNRLEAEIAQTEEKLKQFNLTAEQTGKTFADKMKSFRDAILGVQQIADTFNRFIEPYKEFDKQLRNIGTLGIKNYEEFRDKIIEIAAGVPDTVAQVTEGVYNAISAGAVKVKDGIADIEGGLKFVEVASKLAVAGLTDTNSAIKSLAANLNAYGEASEEAERYADILFNTVNNGVTTIPELNSTLYNVVPTAAALGVKFEEVAAAIATMTQQGVPTAQSTTMIRQALVELAKPGAALAPIMQKAGVSLESLKQEGLQVSLEKIGRVMEELGLKANQVFSSVEAAGAVMALSGEKAQKFADILSTYSTDAIGSTQRAFEIASEGIGVKVQGVLNQIEAAFFKFFHAVGDGFVTMLSLSSQLAPIIMTFTQLSNVLPFEKIKTQVSLMTSGFSSFIKEVNGTGNVLTVLQNRLVQSGGVLAKLAPIITNPWTIGIGAAIAGLGLFLTQTERGQVILSKFGDVFDNLKEAFEPVFETLADVLGETIEFIINLGELVYELLIAPFEVAIEVVDEIIKAFSELFGVSSETISIAQILSSVISGVGSVFEYASKGVQVLIYAIRAAKDFIVGMIEAVPELLSVLYDYAKYYLNPVNWFAGDEDYERELSERLTRAVQKATSRAKDTIAEAKMDFALQEAMSIKEDLDKNKKIEQLVDKFMSAKNEIEANNIAKEIAKYVPDAVEGYKQVIDENGKLVEVLDVNIAQVKDLVKANEQLYSDKLKSQQDSYVKALKDKSEIYHNLTKEADYLAKTIMQGAMAGADVSGLKAKYDEIQDKLKVQTQELAKALEEGSKIGIEIDKVELPSTVEEQFAVKLQDLRNKAKGVRIGEALEEMMQIKRDLDANDRIGALVSKFEKAKSDVAKASIAEEIAKQVPEAVRQIGVIQDKEGNLIKQYEIQKDKLQSITEQMKQRLSSDLISKQEQYIEAVKSEGDAYLANQTKLQQLQTELNRSREAGIDTSKIEAELQKVNQQLELQKNSIIEWSSKAVKGGIDANRVYEQVARTFNLSVEEAKMLIEKQKISKRIAEEQVQTVDKLAEAWNAATSELDSNIKKQLGAINEISRKMYDKSITAEQRKELEERYKSELKALKENVAEKKKLDEIDEKNQIRAGLKVVSGKSLFEIAKDEANERTKLLEIEQKNYEFILKQKALNEGRKIDAYEELLLNIKQIETIEQQRKAWIDVLKAKKLITEIKEDGTIVFGSKVKKADKAEIQSVIQDYNFKLLDEQNKINDLKLKLKADDIELQNKLNELERKKLEWQISIGIKEEVALESFVETYRNRLNEIQAEIVSNNKRVLDLHNEMMLELSKATSEQEQENIRIKYQMKLKLIKEKNLELVQSEFETQQKIREIEDKIYNLRLQEIEKWKQSRLNAIEKQYEDEAKVVAKFSEMYNKVQERLIETEKDKAIEAIKKRERAKLEELEYWRSIDAISEEEHERRKIEIQERAENERLKKEEEFRKKQLALSELQRGIELEQQRRKEAETIIIQQDAIRKQIELLLERNNQYDELGKPIFDSEKDRQEYEALKQRLDELNELLKQKGDEIGIILNELQTTITDSITNLFSGDTEAIADNWRKFFAIIAGILQKKISAFVLDMILSPGVVQYLSTLPFPLNITSIPIIKATVSSAVKAITDPILTSLLSFASGGRIDKPMLAIVGDGARLGETNREWIFRDSQLIATVQMATNITSNLLIAKLDRIEKLLSSQELHARLRGEDINIILKRQVIRNNNRSK